MIHKKILFISLFSFLIIGLIAIVTFLFFKQNVSPLSAVSQVKGYRIEVTNPKLYDEYMQYFNFKSIYIENMGYVPLGKVMFTLTDIPQPFDINQTPSNPPVIIKSASFLYNPTTKILTINVYINKELILEKSTPEQNAEYIENSALYRMYVLANIENPGRLSNADFYKELNKFRGDDKHILTVTKE